MKNALFAASLVLVAGAAVGCGGSDGGSDSSSDAPKTVSTKVFCAGADTFQAAIGKIDADADVSDQLKAAKAAVSDLRDVGVPEDMPADAKEGLGLSLDTISDLPDDATEKEVTDMQSDLSAADTKKVTSFSTYVTKTCTSS